MAPGHVGTAIEWLGQTRPGNWLGRTAQRLWARGTHRYPVGTNVYDREWDVLVLLDTCRVDALEELAPEYEFLETVDSICSVGSTSAEWIANTFRDSYREEIEQTACLTTNAYMKAVLERRDYLGGTRHVVDPDAFGLLVHLWETIPPSERPFFHPPPRALTDRAIELGRRAAFDRVVLHYRPPHAPYTARAIADDREPHPYEKDLFAALHDGEDRQRIWEAYLDELRAGLDEVELLVENLDADRVAISADHGEAFGEWGIYSHPLGAPVPAVRRVPWVVTSATDTGEYDPERDDEASAETERQSLTAQLQALGYRE